MAFWKRRHSNPNPSWAKWIVLGFAGLAFLNHWHKNPESSPQKIEEKIVSGQLFDLKHYKSKLFPESQATLHWQDAEIGSGAPAVCGQQVSIAYDTFLEDGKAVGDAASKDKPLKFSIGDGKAIPAFEQGVLGMKTGGRRSLIAPPQLTYGSKDFSSDNIAADATMRFEVTLLEASPALPGAGESPFRITDVKNGFGRPVACGQQVKALITVWGTDGKKLFSTRDNNQPITFTPEKSEVFMGLEQGVLGMLRGGSRTLIVPPAYQKTMSGAVPLTQIPLPKNQTVLVDVEAIP